MDEELMNVDIQETTEILVEENIEEVQIEEDLTTEIVTEEEIDDIGVTTEDPVIIDMSEGMGWVSGDNRYHNSLLGIDYPNQHPITAISGLREELDEIERIKTVIADKTQIANYYQWADNKSYDVYGYFVSLVPNTSTICICEGADIFGVSVETAGFIGQQELLMSNINTYGLIVTSGLVLVRCELDVEVGDYVISNSLGYAVKAASTSGYKVFARVNKKGIEYAVIILGVQADVTNALGIEISSLDKRLDAAESNIVSAVNVANQAYNKSNEIIISNQEMSDEVDDVLDKIEDMITDVENMGNQVAEAKEIAASARGIAESSANYASNRANDAWSKADQVATEAYSLCAKIDEYSVGEYSQAYGLTYEQAQNILQVGMMYVPTKHINSDTHPEEYMGEPAGYKREFTPGFLYMWGELPSGGYGWITIDKNYLSTDETNLSSMAVYFAANEPTITAGDSFGYWYTDADEVYDKDGNISTQYKPYTLYKWEVDHWISVATLKGNASNRMVSEVYQLTNEIMMDIINPRGGIAGFNAKLTDTESTTQQLAAWKNGEDSSEAIIRQHTEDGKSSIVIATLQKNDGVVTKQASLVLTAGENSALTMSADNIVLEGNVALTTKDENDGKTKINGANIATGSITADQIAAGSIKAESIEVKNEYGTLLSAGNNQVSIGGWKVDENRLTKGTFGSNDFIGLYSQYAGDSLKIGNTTSDKWSIVAGKNFGVTSTGEMVCSSGAIAGWGINTLSMCYEPTTYDGNQDQYFNAKAFICPNGWKEYGGYRVQIAGHTAEIPKDNGWVQYWAMKIGDNFGVSTDGNLHCANADITGKITAKTGKIGSTTITDNGIEGLTNSKELVFQISYDDNNKQSNIKVDNIESSYIVARDAIQLSESNDFSIGLRKINTGITDTINVTYEFRATLESTKGGYAVVVSCYNATTKNLTKYQGQEDLQITVKFNMKEASQEPLTREVTLTLKSGASQVSTIVGKPDFGYIFEIDEVEPTTTVVSYTDTLTEWAICTSRHFGICGPKDTASHIVMTHDCIFFNKDNQSTPIGQLINQGEYIGMKGTWKVDGGTLTTVNGGNISTSDLNSKYNIIQPTKDYETMFDLLSPCLFKFKEGSSGRLHCGFIAQEVEQAFLSSGLRSLDFAGYVDDFSDNDDAKGLRYEEFIALNTWQIQKAKARIAELEERVVKLESLINEQKGE